MIHVKIKYHEKKMMQQNNEKNIKMQETIIRQLQKDLFEARKKMEKESSNIIIESQINFISY
jgi:Txe/YoeB family toxin of Txe-Axe toxin-antitoxin module